MMREPNTVPIPAPKKDINIKHQILKSVKALLVTKQGRRNRNVRIIITYNTKTN